MMREQVAPALRGLGIKGSGQSFANPSERYWALIGFQKSRRSSSAVLEFTVNLTVVSRAASVLASRRDRWWSVAADRPTEPVAREVVDVIRDVGLPAMRERMS
jgi:hypothetical protein